MKFAGSVVVGFDFTKDYKANSMAVKSALKKRDAMVSFNAVLPVPMQVDKARLNPDLVVDPEILEIAMFPNFFQLGLIAQRASIPAPYLPNRYLQNYSHAKGR